MRRQSADAILRWTARAFGDDTATRVFEPLVADWQREWTTSPTALARGRSLISGSLSCLAAAVASAWQGSWRWEASNARQAAGLVVSFFLGGVALLLLAYIPRSAPGGLALLFLPACAALALPATCLPVALWAGARAARRGDVAGSRLRLAGIAGVVSMLLVCSLGWVVPASNQAFRAAVVAFNEGDPALMHPGVREVSALTLASTQGREQFGAAASRELEQRLTIALLWPATLLAFGWRLGRHRGTAGPAALTFWWLMASLVWVLVAAAPGAGFVFDAPARVCAFVWTVLAVICRPRHAGEAGAA